MEVKPGYKQTEVGVIPEDWTIVEIGNVCTIFGRIGFRGYTINDIVDTGYGAIAISPSNIKDNKTDFTDCTYISWRKYEESPEIKIYNGDIILVKTGSTFGKTAIVKNLTEHASLNPQLVVLKKLKINNYYLGYMMDFKTIQAQISAFIVGGALPTLSQNLVAQFKLPFPPTLAEQEAIAGALSDADALIESIEQLIAKKRLVKQGAMQELLTGKRRLPGFEMKPGYKQTEVGLIPEDWDDIQLGSLGRWTGGMTPSMRNPDYWKAGTIPWISSGDVKSVVLTTTGYCISEYAVMQKATTIIPEKSIVVVMRSGILRKYLPVAMNMIPMAINQDIKALIPSGNVNTEYILQSFISNGKNILARCLKSGTTVESIEFPWLKAFTIPIPSAIAEQGAIASILSDMDTEISALEGKLVKARQIKQGMMQELLTGRIRLV